MTQKIIVRTLIVLFGLIAVSVIGALLVVGDGDPSERLREAAEDFRLTPSDKKLRRLLNIEADGGYAFLKIALVGRSFAEHPESFRVVKESPATDLERVSIEDLARLGEGVFDYHGELKSPKFEATFRDATWLRPPAQHSGRGDVDKPSN